MSRRVGVLVVALLLVGAGCGGGSGVVTADAFVNGIDDVCRTLDRDLGDLGSPSSLDEMATYASDASKAFESALSDLKQLKVPANGSVVADAKDLLGHFDDEITQLDKIAKSAAAGDQDTASGQVTAFNTTFGEANDLGGSLGARRCSFDPMFAFDVAGPPVTDPPATDPPATDPPVTDPSIAPPPTVSNASNKTVLALAGELPPTDGYTFAPTDDAIIQTFILVLDSVAGSAAQAGQVAGTEVIDSAGTVIARVFVFLPEATLPAGVMDELVPVVVGPAVTSPAAYGLVSGVGYSDGNGTFFFGSNDPTAAGVVLWAVGADQAGLDAGVGAFLAALAG